MIQVFHAQLFQSFMQLIMPNAYQCLPLLIKNIKQKPLIA